MACDRSLEPRPFLVMDFRSGRFFLDGDRDGCVDRTGELVSPEIDPADFLPAIHDAEEPCNGDLVGQRRLDPSGTPRQTGGPLFVRWNEVGSPRPDRAESSRQLPELSLPEK